MIKPNIEIYKADNGFVLVDKDGSDGECNPKDIITVIEETDDDSDTMCALAWAISEMLGMSGGKYDSKNFKAVSVPGRSFSGPLGPVYLESLVDLLDSLLCDLAPHVDSLPESYYDLALIKTLIKQYKKVSEEKYGESRNTEEG